MAVGRLAIADLRGGTPQDRAADHRPAFGCDRDADDGSLEDAEFVIPGQIVADIALVEEPKLGNDGSTEVKLEALTVEEAKRAAQAGESLIKRLRSVGGCGLRSRRRIEQPHHPRILIGSQERVIEQ